MAVTGPLSHAERYERAEEYMRVVIGLWDSWSDDAVLDDRAGGQYARVDGLRALNHAGRYYQVTGPLNMPTRSAGKTGFRAGRVVGDRAPLCCPLRRGRVHRPDGKGNRSKDFYVDLKRLVAEEGRRNRSMC